MPIARDQSQRPIFMSGEPPDRLLRIGASVDRLAAEVDAACEPFLTPRNPVRKVRFGDRRIDSVDQQPLCLMGLKDVDCVLDPARAPGEYDRSIGRRRIGGGRYAERESKQDKTQKVEEHE